MGIGADCETFCQQGIVSPQVELPETFRSSSNSRELESRSAPASGHLHSDSPVGSSDGSDWHPSAAQRISARMGRQSIWTGTARPLMLSAQ